MLDPLRRLALFAASVVDRCALLSRLFLGLFPLRLVRFHKGGRRRFLFLQLFYPSQCLSQLLPQFLVLLPKTLGFFFRQHALSLSERSSLNSYVTKKPWLPLSRRFA